MKNKPRISEPAAIKLTEALRMLSGLNTKIQFTEEEKNSVEKHQEDSNENSINIIFLQKNVKEKEAMGNTSFTSSEFKPSKIQVEAPNEMTLSQSLKAQGYSTDKLGESFVMHFPPTKQKK